MLNKIKQFSIIVCLLVLIGLVGGLERGTCNILQYIYSSLLVIGLLTILVLTKER